MLKKSVIFFSLCLLGVFFVTLQAGLYITIAQTLFLIAVVYLFVSLNKKSH